MAETATLARPYAEAVFRLADSGGTLAAWSEALGTLGRWLRMRTCRSAWPNTT
jgi:F-type H+-transporting ATPase subunit delta